MSGSTVKVVGDYALSITSLNGSINIQTDINMTCGEMVLNKTCLGGYTQSAANVTVGPSRGPVKALYKGKGNRSFSVASLFHSWHYSDICVMAGLLTPQDLACYLICLTKVKQ